MTRDNVEGIRRALIDVALRAHEDARLSGLCAEGAWEAAVDAMRSLELHPDA
ncbi:MAG: acetyltransferase [Gammaproteobacteria bacterium]|nr:acetyltransferase [Gammaproteobacteria bacterium]